jgi:hypothetical protein
MAGGPSQVAAEKPAKAAPVAIAQPKAEPVMKAEPAPKPKAAAEAPVASAGGKKPKAAHNDDPS